MVTTGMVWLALGLWAFVLVAVALRKWRHR
jgi:hypothetical protein